MKQKNTWSFLTIGVIGLIWHNSWLPAIDSKAESIRFAILVYRFLQKWGTQLAIGRVDHIVRKFAHAFEYMILGICLYVCLSIWQKQGKIRFIWLMGLGAMVAAIDETIQIFSPGRGPMWQDVMLDTFGVFMGFCVANLLRYIWQSRRKITCDNDKCT